MKKAMHGIWTPSGKVICINCHGNTFSRGFGEVRVLSVEEMKQRNDLVALEEGNALTFCDKCGISVQMDDSIANEHNITKLLRDAGIDAGMWQTGGMNSACGIDKIGSTEDRPCYYLITFNLEGDGMYWLGSYNDCESADEDFISESAEEVVKRVVSLTDVTRL